MSLEKVINTIWDQTRDEDKERLIRYILHYPRFDQEFNIAQFGLTSSKIFPLNKLNYTIRREDEDTNH